MSVFVSGLGIISAIGNNVEENLYSLKQKKTGISNIKYLNTIHKAAFKLGEVKLSDTDLLNFLKIPLSKHTQYSRTALLGIIAAQEALNNAGFTQSEIKNIAVVSSTSIGGMDKTEINFKNKNGDISFIKTHAAGDLSNRISDFLKINNYRTCISTACSSAANAIIHAARLIKNNYFDKVLVGGSDALSKFTLNGFNSLMILDKENCKPFDNNRKGLNLGEGAAFIVLESLESIKKRKANYICELKAYANANDTYHQTASSPTGEGAYNSMSMALNMSGLNIKDIDYINAHGTGTQNNDMSEGVAIKRIFGNAIPNFSSTKSYTGHTLGAAAAIEAVFSILTIEQSLIFPNLNFKESIKELSISPLTDMLEQEVNNVLSNSFGFGGNNSTLIFSKN